MHLFLKDRTSKTVFVTGVKGAVGIVYVLPEYSAVPLMVRMSVTKAGPNPTKPGLVLLAYGVNAPSTKS